MEATHNLASAASSTDSKLHFLDYWRIIRLRKAIILTVLFLVVATVSVVTSFLTPMNAMHPLNTYRSLRSSFPFSISPFFITSLPFSTSLHTS